LKFREKIDALREDYRQNPKDIYRGIQCADAMRLYDMQYHEGGTYEMQAIELYDELIAKAEAKRDEAISQKKATNISSKKNVHSANDEVTVDYEAKSEDGLVCALYTAKGKLCFMANMFERAVASYDACLEIAPGYLDAVNARGSALIVLGEYERASHDFLQVIENDNHRLFIDSFSGIARVLEAKEDAVPGGWEAVVPILEELIPAYERRLDSQHRAKNIIAESLNRLHLAMFAYNDVKAKNFPVAFRHLSQAHKHKMSALPPWNKGFELVKIAQTKNIFKAGFWPPGIGSETQTPIFIIGFVRSGSTLLERILDAHSLIVGTGENSVFNGRLDDIRNQIVEVSVSGQPGALESLTRRLAYEVVDEMRNRWEVIEASTERPSDEALKEDPKRFVDKMLTNYYNVGFIQMLYPKALILHVAREPMDTIFSAYKHEFPSGTLDYTSDFEGLAELYHSYRDVMEHWDEVLPGRVTHVRYEDMVNDMPGMARAIIDATGLPWDESVLDFHKKKHAVNTLSSTQVRKGIYKDSLKSWMRYEHELQPLVKLIGDRVKYDLKTTLPSYRPPEGNDA
jgi:tetratricopeptide (TPR) repeat protein